MDPSLDDAIETAAERTRDAEERLRLKPLDFPELVDDARTVDRRTEDLHELALDAKDAAEGGDPPIP